jgi:hypothetical protein
LVIIKFRYVWEDNVDTDINLIIRYELVKWNCWTHENIKRHSFNKLSIKGRVM